MTYILRFSGKDIIGFWSANTYQIEEAERKAGELSKILTANVFIDQLHEGNLTEIYSYKLPE
jgi:hypothetical protein